MDENEWGRVSVTDIHAVIDLPVCVFWERYGTPEYWARLEKELKREAAELEDFIRDHRSRDGYGIDIVKTKSVVCKFCGWVFEDKGLTIAPDCCDEAIDAYEKAHQIRQEKE